MVDNNLFESKILAGAIQKSTIFQRLKRAKYNTDDFNNDVYKSLWNLLVEVGNVGDFDSELLLRYLAEKPMLDEQKLVLKTNIEILKEEDLTGVDLSIEVISKEKTKRDSIKASSEFLKKIKAGQDINHSVKTLKQNIDHAISREIIATPNDYYSQIELRDQQRNFNYGQGSVKSLKMIHHFGCFAKYFDNGLLPETITTLEAETNAGKSVLLINFLKMALDPLNKLNCLYLYSENRELEAEGRLDALLLKKPYRDSIKKTPLNPEDKFFMKNMVKQGYGQLRTCRLPYGVANVEYIRYLLNDFEEQGLKIHAIFIDSPDHLQPKQYQQTYWLNKSAVYEELKALVEEYGVLAVTTRQKNAGTEIGAYAGAGGQGIARIVDNIIQMEYESRDMITSQRNIIVAKARDGVIDYIKHVFTITDWLEFTKLTISQSIDLHNNQLGLGRPKALSI